MEKESFRNYQKPNTANIQTAQEKAFDFYNLMKTRRTVRSFSEEKVPLEVIENCIRTAGTSPSGANKQPWFFPIIKDPNIKRKIRTAAEKEEHLFYTKRASKSWLSDLIPFGTNEKKPYLESAPYLIPIFYKTHDLENEEKKHSYYPKESVGIATGILITSLHNCGLATLTHTPSPMGFLNEVLELPKNQYKPFLLLITGYPSKDITLPKISKKTLQQISKLY